MSKVSQPSRSDNRACFHTEEGPKYGNCLCEQGINGYGEWIVRVDRNGVAYAAWESWKEIPF